MHSARQIIWTVCAGALLSIAQTFPGLPSQPSKGDAQPPVVKIQTRIEKQDSTANHEQALSELRILINEAHSLQNELQANGPAVVSLQSLKRSEHIEQLAKKLRSWLKHK